MSGVGPIRVDASRRELIVITLPEACTVAEVERALREVYDAVIGETGPLALLLDARKLRAAAFSALHRQAAGDGFRAVRKAKPDTVYANGIVLRDALVRGVAMAIMWVSPPKGETKIFADVPEALAFLEEFVARERKKQGGAPR